MTVQFLGAAGEVTGSCYYLKHGDLEFLIDCGMFQGRHELEEKNRDPWPFDPSKIQFVLLTHAHFDHTGRLPKLYHDGFRGKIYTTAPTAELAQYILADAADIQFHQSKIHGTHPLYTLNEVKALNMLYHSVKYDEPFTINRDISTVFRDAGHILGSAIIELDIRGKRYVFSGDLGNDPVPLMSSPETISQADVLFLESTYGDRLHPKYDRREELKKAINDVAKNKGTLLIPAFAVERTQEILYHLNEMHEKKEIPDMPIFVDSPLAIEVTGVFRRYEKLFDVDTQTHINHGDDIFRFPHLRYSTTVEESKAINFVPSPKIIIAGSGMMNGGRILHHMAHYLSLPTTILCVVGFQVPGTIGRQLVDGATEVHIMHQQVPVKAEIRNISAFSAHADQGQLLEWVNNFHGLKKIFVIHGEEEPRQILGDLIHKAHSDIEIVDPHYLEVAEL